MESSSGFPDEIFYNLLARANEGMTVRRVFRAVPAVVIHLPSKSLYISLLPMKNSFSLCLAKEHRFELGSFRSGRNASCQSQQIGAQNTWLHLFVRFKGQADPPTFIINKSTIMKAILFAVLLASVLAGGHQTGRRIDLVRGVKNTISFACGVQDAKGDWSTSKDNYRYTPVGFPNWCTFNNGILYATVPSGWKGHTQVRVDYTGPTVGSYYYTLACDDNTEDPSWSVARWWNRGRGDYLVGCPLIEYKTVGGGSIKVETPSITVPGVNVKVDIPKVNIPAISIGGGHGLGLGNGIGLNLGSFSCDKKPNWSGSAVIVTVGTDYCTLDNGRTIRFANCSTRRYRSGRNNFAVSDKINFDCYDDGKIVWVKSAICIN
mgnify:CR=1 FL=1